jgi:geranylgeranyl diphosphate synthase type II
MPLKNIVIVQCFVIIILITIIIIGITQYDHIVNVQMVSQINNIRAANPRTNELRTYNPKKLLRERNLSEYQAEFNKVVESALKLSEFGVKSKLTDACAYALRGGKRLRPIILSEVCRATTIMLDSAIIDPADAALSIEYLHTASLIIDDAPAFDDDSERRGKPSLHIVNDTATAYMASLSLVSASYQDIVRQVDWIRDNCPEIKNVDHIGMLICNEISVSMGSVGAACGQFMDTTMSKEEMCNVYGNEALLHMLRLKTATFFEIAFVCGWIIAGGDSSEIKDIRNAGMCFGIAYQIADDIGDMEQDAARKATGKPGCNYANEHGREESFESFELYLSKCELIMRQKNIYTPIWEEIFDKVIALAN